MEGVEERIARRAAETSLWDAMEEQRLEGRRLAVTETTTMERYCNHIGGMGVDTQHLQGFYSGNYDTRNLEEREIGIRSSEIFRYCSL